MAFNGQRFAGQRFGVGRYLEYLLRNWATMLAEDESISVFVRRSVEPDIAALHPRITPILLKSRMSGIPWENLYLRGPAAQHDVLFCPAYTSPVAYSGRLVVATHSVDHLSTMGHSWLKHETYGRLHRHCARLADAVVVPAESTKREVTEHYGIAPDRIVVVPQGADDAFRPISDQNILRQVRRRFFGADRPYILFVGKCSARRNIPMLLRAFAELRRTHAIPHGLLLFGPNHVDLPLQALCTELGITEHVVQTDGQLARHEDLVPVYCAADVFVHPSEMEGWSITTVEAMACGVAVVASDRGGLGEVARGHALMMPAPSVSAIVEAVARILSDDALRHELQLKSRRRGLSLRWEHGARSTLDVIRGVAAKDRSYEGNAA